MFQAVVDALAFEARLNLDTLARMALPITELRAVGEGSRRETILRLKATVLGRPIRVLRNPEAALLGAAILAEVVAGSFRNITEACQHCVQVEHTIEPDAFAQELYSDAYDRYRQIYGTLRPFYQNWRARDRVPHLV